MRSAKVSGKQGAAVGVKDSREFRVAKEHGLRALDGENWYPRCLRSRRTASRESSRAGDLIPTLNEEAHRVQGCHSDLGLIRPVSQV